MLQLIEVPVELQALLKLGLEFLVVFVLTELAKYLPFDISGYKAQIVAALFSAVMVLVNGFLGLIPAQFEGVVVALLQFLVVLLGAFGVYALYRRVLPKK
jgi:hypothetical protein